MIKTSHTHPLRIDSVQALDNPGLVGMTFCPGKKQPGGLSGHWQRDLPTDVAAIKQWGASLVISLMEEHEFVRLEVEALPAELAAGGLEWWHLPIADRQAPGQDFDERWKWLAPRLHQRLARGERVLVHCMGGLGRAGTVAARLLIESGMTAAAAIAEVRRARPGAIETRAQEAYLMRCDRLPALEVPAAGD